MLEVVVVRVGNVDDCCDDGCLMLLKGGDPSDLYT